MSNLSRLVKNIGMLFFVLIVFLLLLLFLNSNVSWEIVQNYFYSSMLLTIYGLFLLYAIKSITLTIPNSVLYIAAGVLFPTWLAISLTYAGLLVSLSVGYFTGQKLGETKVYHLLAKQKRINLFLKGNRDNLLSLCFITRLLALPFGLASFFFGALDTPFLKYVFVSLLGVTPTMIPIVFSGSAITSPLSAAFLIPFGVSFTITLAIFIVYKKRIGSLVQHPVNNDPISG